MPSRPELHVLDDPAVVVGELLATSARAGGHIALTGGSTPRIAYERAAALQPDWSAVSAWWGDERCVPPDDERSNFRLTDETLFSHLDSPPRQVHRIRGELPPEEAAAELDSALAGVTLDLVLLGMGSDGHVASLFPGSPQLAVEDRRAVSGPPGLEPFVERVTMTMHVLRGARRIVLLVTGEAKADAIVRAFGSEIAEELPASVLRLAHAPVEVFLDPAAGSKLER